MKLRNLILPLMLAVLLGASACNAAECPVEVVRKIEGLNSNLIFTSVVDTVTIQEVKGNRGDAEVSNSLFARPLPVTLKFGEKWVGVAPFNTIKELEVQTNVGTWTFKFK